MQIKMSAAGSMPQPNNLNIQNGASFLGSMITSARNEFMKNMARSSNPPLNSNAAMSIPFPGEQNKASAGSFMGKIGQRIWSSTDDVSTPNADIPEATQEQPDYQIHFFSAATAEKTGEETLAEEGQAKATTGGSGGGGGNNGGEQRPQRPIDESHTRDSKVVSIKDDQKLKDIIANNPVVLLHDSSVKEYSMFEHLKSGGVDFTEVDMTSLDEDS